MARKSRARRASTAITRSAAPRPRFALARRAASHVASKAAEEKHLMGAGLAALALGAAEANGVSIPHIGAVGEAGTLALVAYGLDRFGIVKSRMLRHAATGLGSIALYQFAKDNLGKAPTAHGDVDAGYRD